MAVQDVRETVEYYVKHFGFTIVMAVSEDKSSVGDTLVEGKAYVWANIMHGDVGFMFQRTDTFKDDVGDFFGELGASSTYYIEVEDVDTLYEKVKSEVEIVKSIENAWYGMREFYVRDCNGYILGFAMMLPRE
jgi:uncharacterized glyoxalase superfamily protein PhnB